MELAYERYDVVDPRHKHILLAEDNEGDIEILREQFEERAYPHSLFVVRDGEEAVQFLRESDMPIDLVMLDINMPRMSGLEALKHIKSDEALAEIPVVMLTSSDAYSDIEDAREFGANGYLIKPTYCTVAELVNLIDLVKLEPDSFIQVK